MGCCHWQHGKRNSTIRSSISVRRCVGVFHSTETIPICFFGFSIPCWRFSIESSVGTDFYFSRHLTVYPHNGWARAVQHLLFCQNTFEKSKILCLDRPFFFLCAELFMGPKNSPINLQPHVHIGREKKKTIWWYRLHGIHCVSDNAPQVQNVDRWHSPDF